MNELKDRKNEVIRHRHFNGDLAKFPSHRLIDCIGLFKIEEKWLKTETGESINDECLFVLGYCGEKVNQEYWFYGFYDDSEKYIVDNHGDGKWVLFDTDDATEIYRKSTLCELAHFHDASVPIIEVDVVGGDSE